MKRIYTAANLADAHLVRDLLQQAGISAHIFNEYAMAAMGDVPMGSAYPQIWIPQPQQEQHARAVIADYEKRVPQTATKICSHCGETSPGEFELCWNCGEAIADAV
jgi:hypothetical protein